MTVHPPSPLPAAERTVPVPVAVTVPATATATAGTVWTRLSGSSPPGVTRTWQPGVDYAVEHAVRHFPT
ncbi:hypothetical protein FHS43_000083 [Streptosporangium becharense]|uniref:Uncharacterized protein n=1 Tax=Streptosporangium becharense TaxID=1816182 RepID=A0A7W9IGU2_9ACTN|nr:hypothetical protein [Streptosporangium becharense]MBB2908837.1 hypothetical protein [Streptosporangium becharense]MBB5820145.1 hypothetical protein [Streptosporangium becharense]